MKTHLYALPLLALLVSAPLSGWAQSTPAPAVSQDQVAQKAQVDLQKSVTSLNALREKISSEKLPLNKKLNEMESKILDLRKKYEDVSRTLDGRSLDLNNLQKETKARETEQDYLSTLFDEFIRNFDTQIHVSEVSKYKELSDQARLASENSNLTPLEKFTRQSALVDAAVDRLVDLSGGSRFSGTALNAAGNVKNGKFVLLGPLAIFVSDDGADTGLAEQRLGSLEPNIVTIPDPTLEPQMKALVQEGQGLLPFDPTEGEALKFEETKETLLEHILAGGALMYPILGLAFLATLVALYKVVQYQTIRTAHRAQVDEILQAIDHRDQAKGLAIAQKIGGPVGAMLAAGIEHIHEPKELIEEVMFEKMLDAKLKLGTWLPFIAVTTSAAPLLGLLGTVTGIIQTFKLMTVYGSGDAKSLSSGISEALITTEFGLYVAIPSMIIYAYLTRKSATVQAMMEKMAIAFLNRLSTGGSMTEAPTPAPMATPALVRPPVAATA